jgi:hypothetical protein
MILSDVLPGENIRNYFDFSSCVFIFIPNNNPKSCRVSFCLRDLEQCGAGEFIDMLPA